MPAIVRDYQREFDALKVSIRRRFLWLAVLQIVTGVLTVVALRAF